MIEASEPKGRVRPGAGSQAEGVEVDAPAEAPARTGASSRSARASLSPKRGRPKKGERAEGSTPRSVRLPDRVWVQLEEEAERRGETVHALLREAIARWLEKNA